MPSISIIVPIYKVEPYLRKCVDSILAQTFTDIELILIDDGSPDNCGKICDEYKAKDERVIVIHQKNAGVSAARNAGLEIAKGDYISFIDSDDWVEPDMYEVLYYVVKDSDADIAACYDCVGDYKPPKVKKDDYVVFSTEEAIKNLADMKYDFVVVWSKLFSRKIIENIRFSSDFSVGEDTVFITEAILNSSNVSYINYQCYHYFIREDSASHELKESFWSIFDALDVYVELVGKYDEQLGRYAEKYLISNGVILSKAIDERGKFSKDVYKKITTSIRKHKNRDSVKTLSRSYKCWLYLLLLGRIPFIAGRRFLQAVIKLVNK